MSQESDNLPETNPVLNIPSEEPSKRLRWIDQARGFVMFYLVVTIAFPSFWSRSLTDTSGSFFNHLMYFLFEHAGKTDTYMTLFDVGAAAFIFMLGLMMSVSFRKHEAKNGTKSAIKHIIIRYGVLSLLGLLIMLVNNLDLVEEKDGMMILSWDVVPSIAAAGWATFAFIFVRDPKVRLILGYLVGLIYQILMVTWVLKDYAIASVHGGVFGGFLGYGAISIVASAIGDYMFFSDVPEEKKYSNMLIFGIINFVLGVLISYIPGWEASKRQVSFTHDLISIGATAIGLWIFSVIDRKMNKDMKLFQAFGMNPFFVYFIIEVPNLLVDSIVGSDLGLEPEWLGGIILTIVYTVYASIVMLHLYSKKKVVSTEKSALMMLIVSIALFALILAFFPDIL